MITIVDSGGSNLGSVQNAFLRLGIPSEITSDADRIYRASKVVLPGVGAAGRAMSVLHARELIQCIQGLKQPVLGICLGMQLMFEYSEEDLVQTLAIVPGQVRQLPRGSGLPVPHLGWNSVEWVESVSRSRLVDGIESGAYFYFVHSFAAELTPFTVGISEYGHPFSALIEKDNFFGAQFHPERSGATGARLLKNFGALER